MPRPDPPAAPKDALVSLATLAPGRAGIIERVDREDAVTRRLMDLGFVPPTEVRVLRRAPMGDPVSYEVRGSRLCLRQSEARRVWVRVVEAVRA